MSLEPSFSIEQFPSYVATKKNQKFQYNRVVFLYVFGEDSKVAEDYSQNWEEISSRWVFFVFFQGSDMAVFDYGCLKEQIFIVLPGKPETMTYRGP